MPRTLLFALILPMLLSACSARSVYTTVQNSQWHECNTLNDPHREQCLSRMGPDYRTYEHQRQQLLKDE